MINLNLEKEIVELQTKKTWIQENFIKAIEKIEKSFVISDFSEVEEEYNFSFCFVNKTDNEDIYISDNTEEYYIYLELDYKNDLFFYKGNSLQRIGITQKRNFNENKENYQEFRNYWLSKRKDFFSISEIKGIIKLLPLALERLKNNVENYYLEKKQEVLETEEDLNKLLAKLSEI